MEFKESFTMELKSEVTSDLKKEIIAFANSDGGVIFIGVNDSGIPVGVASLQKTMEQIGNLIRDGIKPDLTSYTTINAESCGGIEIIKISVLRGSKRPYHLRDKGLKPTGVFLRHGVSSVPATEDAIRQMIRENDGIVFDKSRSVNQDLTFNYAKKYFEDSNIPFKSNNIKTLRLLDVDGYYTNAALLLSEQCEHSIKCAVFEGVGKTKFKARKEFYGSILKQLEEAYDYIDLSNNTGSDFNKLKRVDNRDYPLFAIREALINAIIHRDYDYSGSLIVNIFTDRMEFISIGGLCKGITIQDILGGVSQPRNEVIANIFYRLELIESYGTGIQRIFESYEEYRKLPLIRPAPTSFLVTLPNTNTRFDVVEDFTLKESRVPYDVDLSNEEKAMALFVNKTEITRIDVEKAISASKFLAIGTINNLLAENRIRKIGSARSTRYILKK